MIPSGLQAVLEFLVLRVREKRVFGVGARGVYGLGCLGSLESWVLTFRDFRLGLKKNASWVPMGIGQKGRLINTNMHEGFFLTSASGAGLSYPRNLFWRCWF